MKLRHDVPTAGPDETIAAVRARVDASPYRFALVLAADRTLLGRLRHTMLAGDPEAAAQQVMELGPSTTRPDSPLASVQSHLRDHQMTYMIVTDPEGRLLGTVHAADLKDEL